MSTEAERLRADLAAAWEAVELVVCRARAVPSADPDYILDRPIVASVHLDRYEWDVVMAVWKRAREVRDATGGGGSIP